MFRNETGLQVLESGDEVKVGNGKVLYNVSENYPENGTTVIVSQNTQRLQTVETARLTLVTNIRDKFPVDPEEVTLPLTDAGTFKDTHPATGEPVVETSAYAKAALFALNALQKHVYAGTVRKNVKAKRRALGRRQKVSRKANR